MTEDPRTPEEIQEDNERQAQELLDKQRQELAAKKRQDEHLMRLGYPPNRHGLRAYAKRNRKHIKHWLKNETKRQIKLAKEQQNAEGNSLIRDKEGMGEG
jgi:hypothetical protein